MINTDENAGMEQRTLRHGGKKMGSYLNPGNGRFREALNSQVYVDKTGLIACTNAVLQTNQKYICVSRPRRFG